MGPEGIAVPIWFRVPVVIFWIDLSVTIYTNRKLQETHCQEDDLCPWSFAEN